MTRIWWIANTTTKYSISIYYQYFLFFPAARGEVAPAICRADFFNNRNSTQKNTVPNLTSPVEFLYHHFTL